MKRLMGYAEAAAYLSIPVGTLRSMVSRRQIPHVRLTARIVKFDLADLDAIVHRRRVPAGPRAQTATRRKPRRLRT